MAEKKEGEGQLPLLPDDVPQPELRHVLLTSLPEVRAKPEYLELTKRLRGVHQTVALVEVKTGGYRIADGRRRIASARKAAESMPDITSVPAMVFPAGTPLSLAAALTLTLNMKRSASPLMELEAIEELLEQGANIQQICDELGLTKATVEKRLKLAQLTPAIREAVADGRIAAGVAEQIAGLDARRQRELEKVLKEKNTITGAVVREARQVRTAAAVQSLDASVFVTPGAEVLDGVSGNGNGVSPWKRFLDLLHAAEKAIPADADAKVARALRKALRAAGLKVPQVA